MKNKENKMDKLMNKLFNDMEAIWDKAYGPNAKCELETVFDMYEELNDYWYEHFNYSSFSFEGYKIICEGLGDAYFMFNTDGPEQNDVIGRLCDLVEAHPDDTQVKKEISNIREKEIKEDF